MTNGNPKDTLKPVAKGLVDSFFRMVNRASDTQSNARWTFTHWDVSGIPNGYEAEVKLTLRHTGDEVFPHRRAEDKTRGEDG
jgi:hypothetical protein